MGLKLKICGMRDPKNIRQIAALNPDYMGFIFYERSKRFVGENFVIPSIPAEINKVGVFVNSNKEKILNTVSRHGLGLIQLHGDESPDLCGELKRSVKTIKAFGLNDAFDFGILNNYLGQCDYFLFDNQSGHYGGSGKSFNWDLIKDYSMETPFFLSGGIGLGALEPLLKIEPGTSGLFQNLFALDLNSKFEISPGLKDSEKLKKFKDGLFSR